MQVYRYAYLSCGSSFTEASGIRVVAQISGILLRAFQRRHCFGENLFRCQMATQEHLYCERESCPFFDTKGSPHVFLIVLKFGACHEYPPARVNRGARREIVLLSERKEAGRIARPLALPAACKLAVSGSRFRYLNRIYSSSSGFPLGCRMVDRTESDTCRPKRLPALWSKRKCCPA